MVSEFGVTPTDPLPHKWYRHKTHDDISFQDGTP